MYNEQLMNEISGYVDENNFNRYTVMYSLMKYIKRDIKADYILNTSDNEYFKLSFPSRRVTILTTGGDITLIIKGERHIYGGYGPPSRILTAIESLYEAQQLEFEFE